MYSTKIKKERIFDHRRWGDRGKSRLWWSHSLQHVIFQMISGTSSPKEVKEASSNGIVWWIFLSNNHLLTFKLMLSFKGAFASIMCCGFSLSLKSTALKWFQSLPSRSTNSWLDLREKFWSSFAASKERPKTKPT